MISRILPGLRHVRTPLIVGYMWFASVWLILHDRFPTASEAERRFPAFDSLLDFAGATGTAVIMSFLAYIVGSLNVEFLAWMRDEAFRVAYGRSTSTEAPSDSRDLQAVERRVSNEAAQVDFTLLPVDRVESEGRKAIRSDPEEGTTQGGRTSVVGEERQSDEGHMSNRQDSDRADVVKRLQTWGIGTGSVVHAGASEYQMVDALSETVSSAEDSYTRQLHNDFYQWAWAAELFKSRVEAEREYGYPLMLVSFEDMGIVSEEDLDEIPDGDSSVWASKLMADPGWEDRAPRAWTRRAPKRRIESLLVPLVVRESESPGMVQRLLVASEGIHTEYDRLASESEMRLAIVLPLLVLAAAAILTLPWGFVTEIAIAVASGAAAYTIWIQGRRISRLADGVVKKAIGAGVIDTDTLELLRDVRESQQSDS